jgi:hypothetical protein
MKDVSECISDIGQTGPLSIARLDFCNCCFTQELDQINLPKCDFGNKEVAYLCFQLTKAGILPGADILKAI